MVKSDSCEGPFTVSKPERNSHVPHDRGDLPFVIRCYGASFLSAYAAAWILSFPMDHWNARNAQLVAMVVQRLLLFLTFEGTSAQMLLCVLACVAVSTLWVVPCALFNWVSRPFRVVAVCIFAALASIGLFFFLALTNEWRVMLGVEWL